MSKQGRIMRRHILLVWVYILCCLLPDVSHGQMHKCVAPTGVVSYSDKPCSDGNRVAPESSEPKINVAPKDQLFCAVAWHDEMRKFVDALGMGFAGDKIIWNGREVELKYDRVPIQTVIDFALCKHVGIKHPANMEDFITNSWNAYRLMCTLGDRKRQEALVQALAVWGFDQDRAVQTSRRALAACSEFLAKHSNLNDARRYFRSQYVETLLSRPVEATRVMPKGQISAGATKTEPKSAIAPAPAPAATPYSVPR